MWRALRSGSLWALFGLIGVGAACSERPKPPPPSSIAGTTTVGTAGAVSVGGSRQTDPLSDCAGPPPFAPFTRWSFVDLDGTLDMLFGPGVSLTSLRRIADDGYERDLSEIFVQTLRQVAQARADSAVADDEQFESCGEDDDAPTCIAPWLRSWGEKLYRRPLTREQTDAYVVQFGSARRELSPAEAARNALVSMILSPYFVFRIELSDPKTGQLTPDELAARLSYYATRRAADPELRASAAAGKLTEPAARQSELRRLWQTPAGRNARTLQYLAWLGLDVDRLPSTLSPELRAALVDQTKLLIDDVLANEGGTLVQLLTTSRQPLSPLLAEHYGLTITPANGFADLDANLFAGMLSQGLFLSSYPGPTQRGMALLGGLLCREIPPHSGQIPYMLGPGETPRERLGVTTANAGCAGCHAFINPIGFALEGFDDQGRLTGFDTTGSVPFVDSATAVANPGELGRVIATNPQGARCAARHYLAYMLDHRLPDGERAYTYGIDPRPAPAPIPDPTTASPSQKWVECLLRELGPDSFNLTRAAELLVGSKAFASLPAPRQQGAAFDTSVSPLEHALQETRQFRQASAELADQATLDRYITALEHAQILDETRGTGGQGFGGANTAGADGDTASGMGGALSATGGAP